MAKKKSATAARASARPRASGPSKAPQRPATAPAAAVAKVHPVGRQRMTYSQSFKLDVVRHSLRLPATARIKPTCRAFPGIEPVQIRKWIRNLAPLALLVEQQQAANPNGKSAPGSDQPTRLPSPEREESEGVKMVPKAARASSKPAARGRRGASPPSQAVYRAAENLRQASMPAHYMSDSVDGDADEGTQHSSDPTHIDLECIDHTAGGVYDSLVPEGGLDISRTNSTSTSATATPPYVASPTGLCSPTVHPNEPPRASPRPCPTNSPAHQNSPILGPVKSDFGQMPPHPMMHRPPSHFPGVGVGVPPSQPYDALSLRSLQLAQQAQQAVQHVKAAQAHVAHFQSNPMMAQGATYLHTSEQTQSGGNRTYPLPIRLGPSLLSNHFGGNQFGSNHQFGAPFHGFSPLHPQVSGAMQYPGYGLVQRHQPPAAPATQPPYGGDVAEAPRTAHHPGANSAEFEEAAKDLLLLCTHGA